MRDIQTENVQLQKLSRFARLYFVYIYIYIYIYLFIYMYMHIYMYFLPLMPPKFRKSIIVSEGFRFLHFDLLLRVAVMMKMSMER